LQRSAFEVDHIAVRRAFSVSVIMSIPNSGLALGMRQTIPRMKSRDHQHRISIGGVTREVSWAADAA
jgi:hypothetical protein